MTQSFFSSINEPKELTSNYRRKGESWTANTNLQQATAGLSVLISQRSSLGTTVG